MDNEKHLSWFLGPKAENTENFEDMINLLVKDYIHWRRNYFPEDPILISKSDQRRNEDKSDLIYQNLHYLMAQLRRNFPFYSPRYIAHMLSDVSIPSMIGYFGGMLYNSNNVTPEAAPVTTEWEIESCNEILTLLGFKPSPSPPLANAGIEEWKDYEKKLVDEFGWAHITSGGTVANIEALWVARVVKYSPLSIQDICRKEKLKFKIKLANGNEEEIQNVDKFNLLNIKPNESIYLLSKFTKALQKEKNIDIQKASDLASELLSKSKYGIANGYGKLFSEFPPVLFCSGAAHYSVKKAADLLGIGKNNVRLIETNDKFQIDIKALEKEIDTSIKRGEIPLAVIGVCSTTEEGAVDPIHNIIDLRKNFENNNYNFHFFNFREF